MAPRVNPLVISAAVLSVIVLVTILSRKPYNYAVTTYDTQLKRLTGPSVLEVAETFKQQRNEISKMMNEVKQELAILSCENIDLKRKSHEPLSDVSASGGWCQRSSSNSSGQHKFDSHLASELSLFLQSKSVASFGDGPGDYKRYLDKTHQLRVYDAYDGAPYGPETSGGAVKFLDLTAPQYGLPVYDWILSLEVAEHIPAKYESIFIDNIARHAGTGIVLSWAVPGQGGLSHVNNRPKSYVQKILSEKGFYLDIDKSSTLQKAATLDWLKRNINVYVRRKGTEALSIYA